MYIIYGFLYSNNIATITCTLSRPISTLREARIKFEHSRAYTDNFGSGLYDSSKEEWISVIVNKKNNPTLLDYFNERKFKPTEENYPLMECND